MCGGEVKWFLEGDEVNFDFLYFDEFCFILIELVIDWNLDIFFIFGNIILNFIFGKKVVVFYGFNLGKLNWRGYEDYFNIRGCFDLYCI